jgi:hypothetical protein
MKLLVLISFFLSCLLLIAFTIAQQSSLNSPATQPSSPSSSSSPLPLNSVRREDEEMKNKKELLESMNNELEEENREAEEAEDVSQFDTTQWSRRWWSPWAPWYL